MELTGFRHAWSFRVTLRREANWIHVSILLFWLLISFVVALKVFRWQ
jgi:hypothetical protein